MFYDICCSLLTKKKKRMPEISGTQTFSASVAKRKGIAVWTVFKSGTNLFKNTFVFFFIIKLAHFYVVFRSKAHKCQRFDTKL